MPSVRQTNFGAGEVDPKLWGRSDVEKFAHGARRMRNFFPSKQGAAVSRPGSQFVRDVEGNASLFDVRLVPFIYSATQSYVLEFGHLYVQFYSNGGVVDDVVRRRLYFRTQSANFTVGSVVTGGTSTAFGTIESQVDLGTTGYLVLTGVTGAFLDGEGLTDAVTGVAVADGADEGHPYRVTTPYSNAQVADLQWAQSGDVLILTHPEVAPRTLSRLAHASWPMALVDTERMLGYRVGGGAVGCFLESPLGVPDATHPAQEWKYAVTIVYRDLTTNAILETLPHYIPKSATNKVGAGAANLPARLTLAYDRPQKIFMAQSGGTLGFTSVPGAPISSRIYRGFGQTLGLVGEVDWLVEEWTDVGAGPDYSQQPPNGTNPFKVYNASSVLVRTEEPGAVAFYQDRLCFGGTVERPEWFFGSRTGDYYNFDTKFVALDSDAVKFALLARKRAVIRSFLPLNRLLALTSAGPWVISGQEGQPLKFDSVDARQVDDCGANGIPPLSIEGCALYVKSTGRGVRALVPANTQAGYKGVDISTVAQHLFGSTVRDWAYQQDPWGVVWACTVGGQLRSLTFSPEDGQWAWARHDSWSGILADPTRADPAIFRQLCVVPEGTEDAVYAVVLRADQIPKVERFVSRLTTGRMADGKIGLDCSSHYEGAPTDTFTGLTQFLVGAAVKVVVAQESEVPQPVGVSQPIDFIVYDAVVEAGGVVTLPEVTPDIGGTSYVDIGLPFLPQLETLDVVSAQVRTRQKAVTRIGVEVDQTRGIWAGQDFDHLDEFDERDVAVGYGPMAAVTGLVRMAVTGTWSEHGRVAIEQRQPLPITILGITREVDVGD